MRGTPPFGHDHWPCALVLADTVRLLGDPTSSRSRNLWKSSHKGPESGSGGPTRNSHMAGKTRGNERQGAEATQKQSTPPQPLALSQTEILPGFVAPSASRAEVTPLVNPPPITGKRKFLIKFFVSACRNLFLRPLRTFTH